jgi:hypothetical protein
MVDFTIATSHLTTPASNGKVRSNRQPKRSIGAFSTSTSGAFSIRCVTKLPSCSKMAAARSLTHPA